MFAKLTSHLNMDSDMLGQPYQLGYLVYTHYQASYANHNINLSAALKKHNSTPSQIAAQNNSLTGKRMEGKGPQLLYIWHGTLVALHLA